MDFYSLLGAAERYGNTHIPHLTCFLHDWLDFFIYKKVNFDLALSLKLTCEKNYLWYLCSNGRLCFPQPLLTTNCFPGQQIKPLGPYRERLTHIAIYMFTKRPFSRVQRQIWPPRDLTSGFLKGHECTPSNSSKKIWHIVNISCISLI